MVEPLIPRHGGYRRLKSFQVALLQRVTRWTATAASFTPLLRGLPAARATLI